MPHLQQWANHQKNNLLCQGILTKPKVVVSLGIDPGYICLPQSKIIMYSFIGVLLSCEKNWKFLAVRRVWAWWLFASVVLTVCFPITELGNVWEPAPPRSTGLSHLFNPHCLGLTLRLWKLSQGLVISMPGFPSSTPSSTSPTSPSATAHSGA